MCGIAGIAGSFVSENITSMVNAMRHRGPDDLGIHSEEGLALGMTRLAVIETSSAGHQPMSNRDGTIWIAYNGETYNFQQERSALEKKGHLFKSNSDTEVVLHMYEEYGDDFLPRIRGMFALAIYDKRKGPGCERLLLGRDQLGIKPLLYFQSRTAFLFASELKSILASGLVERQVDAAAVRMLLTFGSVTQPRTMISGVKMLLPGHRLILENGCKRIDQYWRMDVGRRAEISRLPQDELVSLVRESLEGSVRLQMVSDVQLGAFLSGGVDSSLLVALMARNSSHRIKTFSLGFESEGASIDESGDAANIAQFIGTDHESIVVSGSEVCDHINHIAWALDQPSVDGVNSYFVSLAARHAVTVAISGTGGDELFAGYPWFISMVASAQRDLRHPVRSFFGGVASSVARWPVFDPLICSRLGPRLDTVRGAYGFASRYARIGQIFGVCGATRFLAPSIRCIASEGLDFGSETGTSDELENAPALERVSALCLRGYTQNQLLRDIDAVSMAHSLEVRVPFLDPVLADLALSLPHSAKLGSLESLQNPDTASYRSTGAKKILLDIGKELLPTSIATQPKRGFAMPFESWLKGPLRHVFNDALADTTVKKRGLFDNVEVSKLKKDFLAGNCRWPQPWLLMMTELWCREVLD